MNWVIFVGFAAGICTTFGVLPQTIKSWKTKKTKDVSLAMYSLIDFGVVLWLIYGYIIKDPAILFANALALIIVSSELILKIRYG